MTGHALHDAAGPEGGGGHQGTEQVGCIGAEVEPGDGALQALVGVRGAATVEPVEHHRQVGQIALLLPGGGEAWQQIPLVGLDGGAQLRILGGEALQRPAELALIPGIDVAECRLSRLQPHHARHHAAVHLAADPGNGPITDGGFVGDQNVAGGGTYYLDQRIVAGPGPHRAHVAVKGAAGDHHFAGEMQPLRPLGVRVPTGRSAVQLSVKSG